MRNPKFADPSIWKFKAFLAYSFFKVGKLTDLYAWGFLNPVSYKL